MIGNPTEEELYREAELLEIEDLILAKPDPGRISDAPPGFEEEMTEPEIVTWQQP